MFSLIGSNVDLIFSGSSNWYCKSNIIDIGLAPLRHIWIRLDGTEIYSHPPALPNLSMPDGRDSLNNHLWGAAVARWQLFEPWGFWRRMGFNELLAVGR